MSVLILIAVALSAVTAEQGPDVPLPLQAAIFSKVFLYDNTISEKGAKAKVLVVFSDSAEDAAPVVTAFKDVGTWAKAVHVKRLGGAASEGNVVYLTEGVDAASVAGICVFNKLLSISSTPETVSKGDAALGVEVRPSGKARIVVNLRRLKADGHDISSRILGLARVVK